MVSSYRAEQIFQERYVVIQKGLSFDYSNVPPDTLPKPVFYETRASGTQRRLPAVTVERSWSVTPNYRVLRKSRARIPDLDFHYVKLFAPGVSYNWAQIGPVHTGIYYQAQVGVTPYLSALPPPYPVDWDVYRNTLNAQLLTRAKGSQWNAPIFLAEARKTSKMVVERATNLVNLMRYAKSGRLDHFFKELKSTLKVPVKGATRRFNKQFAHAPSKAAADLWLETRYGWMPLMKDVQDAVNTLQDTMEQPHKLSGRVKARLVLPPLNATELSHYPTDFFGIALWETRVLVGSGSLKAVWHFTINPVDLPARFGLINPLEVAWELVPFSFVADWFLPIGSYLSHLDSDLRFNHLGGSYGQRTETKRTRMFSARLPMQTFSTSSTLSTRLMVDRWRMTSIPSVSLLGMRMKSPLDLGITQVLSSIALLKQQASRLAR